jgi:CheY-like chemotaxis protein
MLVDTLVNVFAGSAEEAAATVEAERVARLKGARILLAEDNEINQQIAVELLESAGALVKVANNGSEAVEILSTGPQPPPFDVVLMDLQMPEMDGYQATAKLRADPRFGALPIIAMTAHATLEERQRCLAAGMDDHLSKPIDPNLLFETVARFYKSVAPPAGASTSGPAMAATTPEAFDLPAIAELDARDGLSRVAGNRNLYLKLLRQFVEHQGPAPSQIGTALSQGDLALAERLAHTLKGVAGNIGARAVQAAAGALEKLIRDRASSDEVESARQQLAAGLDPLLATLRTALLQVAPRVAAQTPTASAATPAQSREAGAQLSKLLSESDPGAADFIEASRPAVSALFGADAWPQFEKLVQNYAFAEALAQLEQALKEFPAA